MTRLGDYVLLDAIAKGTYGSVHHAEHQITKQRVAVKILQKNVSLTSHVKREITALRTLDHANVLKLFEVYMSPTKFFLVCELVDGGDLFMRVAATEAGLSDGDVRHIFKQVCDGIRFCHDSGVAHRDIKLENILLTKDPEVAKIGDFGFSNIFGSSRRMKTGLGTAHYTAPEILNGTEDREYDATQSDMWSMGIVLFAMSTASLPYSALKYESLIAEIVAKGVPASLRVLPEDVNAALRGLLHLNPSRRWTAAQAAEHFSKNVSVDASSNV